MTALYHYHKIPSTRIATMDTYAIGMSRHHISALLEFDVTIGRTKIRDLKNTGHKISFTAWLIRVIGKTLHNHPEAAAYLASKKKLITFDEINMSILIEREMSGKKVPIPLVIENTNGKSTTEITRELDSAKNQKLSGKDLVLHQRSTFYERIYFRLPSFIRKAAWKYLLWNPRIAYRKMGNAVITSVGMLGRVNGWFIHRTVHPISFGIGSVIKKPVVIDDEIMVREILNMTILIDHDVMDGGPMVRMLNDLTQYIENGEEL